jgi:hypothetical protein
MPIFISLPPGTTKSKVTFRTCEGITQTCVVYVNGRVNACQDICF